MYATQCLLQLSIQPQTVSLTKECQTPSYDSPDHRLERNAVFSTSYFGAIFFSSLFFFFASEASLAISAREAVCLHAEAFLNRCISLLPRVEPNRW